MSSRGFPSTILEGIGFSLRTSNATNRAQRTFPPEFRGKVCGIVEKVVGGRERKIETHPRLRLVRGEVEKLSSAIIHRERGRETVPRVPRDRARAVVCQIKCKTRGNCQRERVLPREGWRQTRLGGQSAARRMFISSFQFSRLSMHFQNSICAQRCGIDTGISQN